MKYEAKIHSKMSTNEQKWVKLTCDYCGRSDGLEFATDDGTDIMALILCGLCSVGPKKYSQRYGDLDDFFRDPFCSECIDSQDLYQPDGAKGSGSVKCSDCISEYERKG
jgi:hypothetical protein